MRTFELKKTQRFWSILRDKRKITISYGKIGSKPINRTSETPSVIGAMEKYQKQIADKLRGGYKEATTDDVAPLDATGQAMQDALVENPDDLAAQMAFADWLSEQTDPRHQARGEFIRLQLQLEDEALTVTQRKKLKKREKELLDANERRWLGWRLFDVLFDGGGDTWIYVGVTKPEEVRTYRRGWLDRLKVPLLSDLAAHSLIKSPGLGLLRELVIDDNRYDDGTWAILASAQTLGNVRVLLVVDCNDEEDIAPFVASLPRLEELYVEAMDQNLGNTFSLPTLGNLRVLHVADAAEYDVQALAKNASLGRLQRLALIPDWTDHDHGPHVTLKDVAAIAFSKRLGSLTSLTIHRSAAGDEGVVAIIDSGLLNRLTELDLSNGCITNRGALELAAAPGFQTLNKLTLRYNQLTSGGIRALRRKGLVLDVGDQQMPTDGEYGNDYLYDDFYEGTME